ncbi:MAG: hypothetical protein ACOVO3_09150 [Fluviicola sp.]|jgi:hypothetical protein
MEPALTFWNKALEVSSKEVVLQAIYNQLEKDLMLVGAPVPDLQGDLPMEWFPELAKTLSTLSAYQLKQLLYIVDVPENWSNQLTESQEPEKALAEAIFIREITKVYYKLQFSNQ